MGYGSLAESSPAMCEEALGSMNIKHHSFNIKCPMQVHVLESLLSAHGTLLEGCKNVGGGA